MLITKEQFKKIVKKQKLSRYVPKEEINDLFQDGETIEQTKLVEMLFNWSCGLDILESGGEYCGSEQVFDLSEYVENLTEKDLKIL